MVKPELVNWACDHAVKRAKGSVEDVVVIEVELPVTAVRHHGKGLYYTFADVPRSAFRRAYCYKREVLL